MTYMRAFLGRRTFVHTVCPPMSMEDDDRDPAPEEAGPVTMRVVIASEEDVTADFDGVETFSAARERRAREAADRAAKMVVAAETKTETAAAEAEAAAAATEAEAEAGAAATEAEASAVAAPVPVEQGADAVPTEETAAVEAVAATATLPTEITEKIMKAMKELEEENEQKRNEVETLQGQITMMMHNMQESTRVAVPTVKAAVTAAAAEPEAPEAVPAPVPVLAAEDPVRLQPRVVCAAAAKIVDEIAETLGGADNVPESVRTHLGALNPETAALVWASFNKKNNVLSTQASQLQTAQSAVPEWVSKIQVPAPVPAPAQVQAAAVTKKRTRPSESIQEMLDAATKLAHNKSLSSTPLGSGPSAPKKMAVPATRVTAAAAAAPAPAPASAPAPTPKPQAVLASRHETPNIRALRDTIQMLRQQDEYVE